MFIDETLWKLYLQVSVIAKWLLNIYQDFLKRDKYKTNPCKYLNRFGFAVH